jgi:anti-sigma factor RsiW
MKNHWHEQIQRYLNGQASAEEAASLQAALNGDAELRALYLDYMNLDVALSAAADAVAITENGMDGIAPVPRSRAQWSRHYWPWLAATAAACAALVVIGVLPRHRNPSPMHPDVTAVCSSTHEALARFSVEPPSVFPAWASPTASMLDQPQLPQWDH